MKSKLYFISSMLIFGSIGLIVKGIPLSSAQIALIRGVIGSLFLLATGLIMKKRLSFKIIRGNFILLLLSSAALGFNWILLFEAYRKTTITNATLSYYLAPVIVVFLSPFIFKERLTPKKVLCILSAMIGMILVVQTGKAGGLHSEGLIGIGFGLGAAVFYAMVIIFNKLIKDMNGLETTIIQLTFATVILIPYVLSQGTIPLGTLGSDAIIRLLLVGIVNTGLAYLLYFTSVQRLESQTVAILSYIDPISALIMSAIFIAEKISGLQLLGGILILGGAFISGRDKH
ncbi:MAG: DMT family transporter [Herbinix sp.]|nr:DMT family transporter [Herbinix sp.]